LIGRFIEALQRMLGLPTTTDLIDDLMMTYEEPVLVDGPAEIAFIFNRIYLLIGTGVLVLAAFALEIGWLTLAALAVVVVIALLLVVGALRDHYTRYIITTDRVIRIEGVISRQQNSIPYSKVTDLTFRQSAADRVMSIAKIRIDSANEASPFRELTDLTQPRLFMKTLSTMVNIRQTPNRVGTGQAFSGEPKKVVILRALLAEIRSAGLAVAEDDEPILEAVFDDWVYAGGADAEYATAGSVNWEASDGLGMDNDDEEWDLGD
jgi:membrane protein YdbS with pleckstrin-like domain